MISFSGRHFPKDVIMQEGGVSVDHATLNRWVIHYAPLLENEFRRHHKHSVGFSWRMDETYN